MNVFGKLPCRVQIPVIEAQFEGIDHRIKLGPVNLRIKYPTREVSVRLLRWSHFVEHVRSSFRRPPAQRVDLQRGRSRPLKGRRYAVDLCVSTSRSGSRMATSTDAISKPLRSPMGPSSDSMPTLEGCRLGTGPR